MNRTRRSARTLLPALALATAMSAAPVRAQEVAAEGGGLIDGYSRVMFSFNQWFYGRLDAAGDWWSGDKAGSGGPAGAPPGSQGGLGNVAANLVNEPVTALTALAVGDLSNSWRSVERFAINSTAGVLGWYDTATTWGYGPTYTDAGLSLCRAGVGEWGYVVLPFIGPRTGRDAVADIVLTNAILWTVAGSLMGTGASLQTILVAEAVEIVADVVATRQIDPHAIAIGFDDYDRTRNAYLAQRRIRCAVLRGGSASAPSAG